MAGEDVGAEGAGGVPHAHAAVGAAGGQQGPAALCRHPCHRRQVALPAPAPPNPRAPGPCAPQQQPAVSKSVRAARAQRRYPSTAGSYATPEATKPHRAAQEPLRRGFPLSGQLDQQTALLVDDWVWCVQRRR